MQFVSDRWYDWYSRIIVAVSGTLFMATLLKLLAFQTFDMDNRWGLSYLTLALALMHVLYGLFIHRLVKQKSSTFGATLTSNFIFLTIIVNLLQSTGQLHSVYELLWIFTVFCTGIFGPYSILGFCFLSILYLIILMTKTTGIILVDPYDVMVTATVFVSGGLSYFFWRGKYVDLESQRVAQLSGQLKSSEVQTETLFNSLGDGVILIGNDGKIRLLNPAAAKLTEWPKDEAMGIDVASVITLKAENGKDLLPDANPLSQAVTTKASTTQELQLVSRSGKVIIVSMVVSPVILPKSKEVAGIVAVMRDITTSRAEEHRRADFISTASHEMRTPVAAIEGYLALALNDKVAKVDTKARDFLVKAHTSTQHLGKLFQDLLTSAKAEDGRLVNHPQAIEVGSYLEQIVEGLRFAAEKKNLLMDLSIGSGEAPSTTVASSKILRPLYYAHIDPDRIREVITNLFDNAVKYTDTGKISVGLTGNNDVIQIFIRDTGHGIPAEDVPHLFQKFYRVDNSSTRSVGGTGLGLFICRKIVELYNGRIWVESEAGKGSTFYINLPRMSTQQATDMQAKQNQPNPAG